jgi:hypothetical protein
MARSVMEYEERAEGTNQKSSSRTTRTQVNSFEDEPITAHQSSEVFMDGTIVRWTMGASLLSERARRARLVAPAVPRTCTTTGPLSMGVDVCAECVSKGPPTSGRGADPRRSDYTDLQPVGRPDEGNRHGVAVQSVIFFSRDVFLLLPICLPRS